MTASEDNGNQRSLASLERLIRLIAEIEVDRYLKSVQVKMDGRDGENEGGNLRAL